MSTESPYQNQSEIIWGSINYVKPLVLTHCFLKNALRYEYILLLEADEALVFNFSQYRNLTNMFTAVSAFESYFIRELPTKLEARETLEVHNGLTFMVL